MKKKLTLLLLAVITAVNIIGCGDSSSATYDTAEAAAPQYNGEYTQNAKYAVPEEAAADAYYDNENMIAYEADEAAGTYNTTTTSSSTVATTENASTTNRKLIRDMNLSVETKEYDSLIKNLTEEITGMGGYIEYMDVHNNSYYNNSKSSRNAYLTARIPAAKLDTFVGKIGEVSNITNRTESVRDITLSYVDMQSHKDMLVAERERLMEYLNQAETVEDMMAIEDHLTEVRYQIESMESQLRTYDNQVDYSTVNINVVEVIEYTPVVETTEPKTALERISEGFVHSLKDVVYDVKEFFIDLIIDLPYIILFLIKLAIVLFVLRLILFRNKKLREWFETKKAERKAHKAEKKAEKEAKKAAKNGATAPSEESSANAEDSTQN